MDFLEIESRVREEFIDITRQACQWVSLKGPLDGALLIFCPHTTCGLTINEGYDPDVRRDLLKFFQEIAPKNHGWLHGEGNSDAHIKASLLGASLLIPVEAGNLCLGRWQSVYMFEGDGPRKRRLVLRLLAS